jgi:polysaccharide deacetylase family protein (PEP-CTERM system associated)
MRNAITFDVEDYFQGETLRPFIEFADWDNQEIRVGKNVRALLEILAEFDVKATFFVLGWIAERMPELVHAIGRAGHEIACHGYAHRMIHEQTPDEFREDIRKAKGILEDIQDEAIQGYRAPTFSITDKSLWALDILAEEGFRYDSSIFPVRHDRYGLPSWTRYITNVDLPDNRSIIEAPPLTLRLMGVNLPIAGGGYFRIAPLRVSAWAIRRMNAEGHPAILYFHPWEFDPDQPRFPIPALQRIRHYTNLNTTESKLKELLSSVRFAPLRDVITL